MRQPRTGDDIRRCSFAAWLCADLLPALALLISQAATAELTLVSPAIKKNHPSAQNSPCCSPPIAIAAITTIREPAAAWGSAWILPIRKVPAASPIDHTNVLNIADEAIAAHSGTGLATIVSNAVLAGSI